MAETEALTPTVRDRMFSLAELMVSMSDGELRIAHNEEDKTTSVDMEADHFLKLKKQRLGRDLEFYAFMAKIQGIQNTLLNVLQELLIPIKTLTSAYDMGAGYLREWGREVFSEDKHEQWDDLF